jgi:DNA repair photolyase
MEKKIRGTFEWAKYNENCVTGCSHTCTYCYARNRTISMGYKTPETWVDEIINRKAMQKTHTKRNGRIMFPTTHDITPKTLAACAVYLERMLSVGNEVLIVSKPHLECIQFLCGAFTQYKDQILFRFTIGSGNDFLLGLWEPGAPRFEERLASLKLAYDMGYETSVSCEPMLDDEINLVVDATRNYVTDAIWLGKANNLINRMTNNGASPGMIELGRRLIEIQCDDNIWKLYDRYHDDPIIKWKESIKEVIGLELPKEKGLDK